MDNKIMTATECEKRKEEWCQKLFNEIYMKNFDVLTQLMIDRAVYGKCGSYLEGTKLIRIPPEELD